MSISNSNDFAAAIQNVNDPAALRAMILIADHVISAQHEKITELEEELTIASEESAADHIDAERYALLKFTLPDLKYKAALRGPAFAQDHLEEGTDDLDFHLDNAIERGMLARYRAAFELAELNASARPEVEEEVPFVVGYFPELLPVGILSDEY